MEENSVSSRGGQTVELAAIGATPLAPTSASAPV